MPPAEDLGLITKLAHEIGLKAEGTKDAEREWIEDAARLIERLSSGAATDSDRASATEHLRLR